MPLCDCLSCCKNDSDEDYYKPSHRRFVLEDQNERSFDNQAFHEEKSPEQILWSSVLDELERLFKEGNLSKNANVITESQLGWSSKILKPAKVRENNNNATIWSETITDDFKITKRQNPGLVRGAAIEGPEPLNLQMSTIPMDNFHEENRLPALLPLVQVYLFSRVSQRMISIVYLIPISEAIPIIVTQRLRLDIHA